MFRSLSTAHLVYHVHFRLSRTFLSFFQNFLMNFCDFVAHQQLVYSIAFISECQELFLFFSVFISHLLHKTQKKSASSRSGFKYIIVVFIRQAFFIKFLNPTAPPVSLFAVLRTGSPAIRFRTYTISRIMIVDKIYAST